MARECDQCTVAGLTELWDRTNPRDRDVAENNRRGINFLGFVPGPYFEASEALVIRFADWYCKGADRYVRDHA